MSAYNMKGTLKSIENHYEAHLGFPVNAHIVKCLEQELCNQFTKLWRVFRCP